MPWHDEARAIVELRNGWMDPAGNLLACAVHRHADALAAADAVSGRAAALMARRSEIEDHRTCDGWRADYLALMDDAHSEGWIRIEVEGGGRSRVLVLDGTREALASRRPAIEELAAAVDAWEVRAVLVRVPDRSAARAATMAMA
jgi:hypothetical protein